MDTVKCIKRMCSRPGCTVLIKESIDTYEQIPLCKWCRHGDGYYAHQIKPMANEGPILSKEEFGSDLFDAIRTQAELRSAMNALSIYRVRGFTGRARDLQVRIDELQSHLSALFEKNTIDPTDLKRLMAIT